MKHNYLKLNKTTVSCGMPKFECANISYNARNKIRPDSSVFKIGSNCTEMLTYEMLIQTRRIQ